MNPIRCGAVWNFWVIHGVGKLAGGGYLEPGKEFSPAPKAQTDLTTRMSDQKEIQRLLGFAREHARAALAKPETQRESYLAFCRLNWKRYASGISRSNAESERFANALDRATRDLMELMQDAAAAAEPAESRSPWYPLRDDAVEGALDSVTVYEAAIEAEPPPEPEPDLSESVKSELAIAEALYQQDHARLIAEPEPVPSPIAHSEAVAAEEEDRQAARFGFGGLERPLPAQAPVPKADPELKRRVHDLLRARVAAARPEDES